MVAQVLLVRVVSLEEVGLEGGEEGCPAEKEGGAPGGWVLFLGAASELPELPLGHGGWPPSEQSRWGPRAGV